MESYIVMTLFEFLVLNLTIEHKMKNMKSIFSLLLVATLFACACNSTKPTTTDVKNSNNPTSKMVLTVTDIKNEKDGQTISLKDDKGEKYTTVISIPNGNFVELEVGNRISLDAEEILEMHPAIIVSKNIVVLDGDSDYEFSYEKMEEETIWINARLTEAQGSWGQLMDCYQIQTGEKLKKDGKWDVICDEIKYFTYVEGYYYRIKMNKKWIENHEHLMDRSPYDLELLGVIEKEKDPTYVNPVKTVVSTNKQIYKVGEPIELSFEVKNTGSKAYTFLPWGTPIEDRLTGDCLEVKLNGKTIDYSGIMVKRMAPTEKDYITLKAGENAKNSINLLEGYKLTSPGKYSIQFRETYDGIPASNVVEILVE